MPNPIYLTCPTCGAKIKVKTYSAAERNEIKSLTHVRCSRRECRAENNNPPAGMICTTIALSGWTGWRKAKKSELASIARAKMILAIATNLENCRDKMS